MKVQARKSIFNENVMFLSRPRPRGGALFAKNVWKHNVVVRPTPSERRFDYGNTMFLLHPRPPKSVLIGKRMCVCVTPTPSERRFDGESTMFSSHPRPPRGALIVKTHLFVVIFVIPTEPMQDIFHYSITAHFSKPCAISSVLGHTGTRPIF